MEPKPTGTRRRNVMKCIAKMALALVNVSGWGEAPEMKQQKDLLTPEQLADAEGPCIEFVQQEQFRRLADAPTLY